MANDAGDAVNLPPATAHTTGERRRAWRQASGDGSFSATSLVGLGLLFVGSALYTTRRRLVVPSG